MKPLITLTLCVAALGVAAGGAAAKTAPRHAAAFVGHELSGQANVSMARAQAIALKARPGRITDKELEKEGGGSGLRYSFDVVSKGVTYEVGVDAKTGRVLENGREGPHPD